MTLVWVERTVQSCIRIQAVPAVEPGGWEEERILLWWRRNHARFIFKPIEVWNTLSGLQCSAVPPNQNKQNRTGQEEENAPTAIHSSLRFAPIEAQWRMDYSVIFLRWGALEWMIVWIRIRTRLTPPKWVGRAWKQQLRSQTQHGLFSLKSQLRVYQQITGRMGCFYNLIIFYFCWNIEFPWIADVLPNHSEVSLAHKLLKYQH